MNIWNRRKAFDRILLDIDPFDYIKENKKEFVDGYEDDNLSKISIILGKWEELFDDYFPDINVPDRFSLYIVDNLFALFLLKNSKFDDAIKFLNEEFNKNSEIMRIDNKTIMKYFEDRDEMFFFPALKWFLDDETIGLISDEFLGKMDSYEKELREMKVEEYIRPPSKWDKRLLFID